MDAEAEAAATIRAFFERYDAVWFPPGLPEAEQAAYARAVWAERDAERRRQADREDLRDVVELTTLLRQDVVALTDEQRAALRAKLDATWARLRRGAEEG